MESKPEVITPKPRLNAFTGEAIINWVGDIWGSNPQWPHPTYTVLSGPPMGFT